MKKENNSRIQFVGFLLIASFLVLACSKDEVYDFPGQKMNRIYVATSLNQVKTFSIVHTPAFTSGKVDYKFPVSSVKRVDEDTNVSFSIDNTLIANYNAEHSSEYLPIPTEWVRFENQKLKIAKGESLSEDSVRVMIDKEKLSELKSENGYLLPVIIASLESSKSVISSNRNVVFLKIETAKDDDNIWDDASSVEGQLSQDRSSWSAKEGENSISESSKMFDGIDSWSSYITLNSSTPIDLIIDLSVEVQQISGIHISAYVYDKISFYSSLDGENWTSLGETLNISRIAFYVPVNARYIKCVIPVSGSKAKAYIKEFNIYTNN